MVNTTAPIVRMTLVPNNKHRYRLSVHSSGSGRRYIVCGDVHLDCMGYLMPDAVIREAFPSMNFCRSPGLAAEVYRIKLHSLIVSSDLTLGEVRSKILAARETIKQRHFGRRIQTCLAKGIQV